MIFDLDEVPEYCRSFMSRGRNGYTFNQVIKDAIVFEYHDILNDNPLPDLDIILIRDMLSFVPEADQQRLCVGFGEKLKNRGIIFLGKNEVMPGNEWRPVGREPVSAFVRKE
jgi:purine-binding chemotaxis protein CheW